MKVCKKIAAFLAATLMTASMAATSAFAETYYTDPNNNPNTADTSWRSGVNNYEFNNYVRRKYNDTSIYVVNNSDSSTMVSVYGRTTKTGANQQVNKYNDYTLATEALTLPAHSTRQIRQFIYENGYPYACIYFTGGNANGVWSPDSIGTYPTIN